MPDPKLKEAMAEISAILKRHDIAAVVALSSKTHSEFLYELCPTWSCVTRETDAEGHEFVRVRAVQADFPDKASRDECLRLSVGTLASLHAHCGTMGSNLEKLLLMLSKHMSIEHMDKFEGPEE